MRLMRRVFLVPAFLAVAACQADLSPQTLVEGFRVLGVGADRPEPMPGERVVVEALLADPRGSGRPISRMWVACLLGPGGDMDRCRDPSAGQIVAAGFDETLAFGVPGIPEGSEDAEIIVTLIACAGGTFDLDPGAGGGGDLPGCVGGDGAVAIKRVFVSSAASRNHNPAIATVTVDGEPLSGVDSPVRVSACAEGSCPTRTFVVELADGSVESYTVIAFGAPQERSEELFTSWFATAGSFARIRGGGTLPEVEWTQPAGPGSVDLWFVTHDGRGGQDWAVGRIVLE